MELNEIKENLDTAIYGLRNLRKACSRVSSHMVEFNFDSFVEED